MPYLTVLHQATASAGTAGILYAAAVTLAVLVSLLAPGSSHRSDARETLKILLLRRLGGDRPGNTARGSAGAGTTAGTGAGHPAAALPDDQDFS
jgi:hypothetical protein